MSARRPKGTQLIIYNPYGPEGKSPQDTGDFERLVAWLEKIFGVGSIEWIRYRKNDNRIIVNVLRKKEVKDYLGNHAWELFLSHCRHFERGRSSQVFLFNWKGINLEEHDFSSHWPTAGAHPAHLYLLSDYPRPTWVPCPKDEMGLQWALPIVQPKVEATAKVEAKPVIIKDEPLELQLPEGLSRNKLTPLHPKLESALPIIEDGEIVEDTESYVVVYNPIGLNKQKPSDHAQIKCWLESEQIFGSGAVQGFWTRPLEPRMIVHIKMPMAKMLPCLGGHEWRHCIFSCPESKQAQKSYIFLALPHLIGCANLTAAGFKETNSPSILSHYVFNPKSYTYSKVLSEKPPDLEDFGSTISETLPTLGLQQAISL